MSPRNPKVPPQATSLQKHADPTGLLPASSTIRAIRRNESTTDATRPNRTAGATTGNATSKNRCVGLVLLTVVVLHRLTGTPPTLAQKTSTTELMLNVSVKTIVTTVYPGLISYRGLLTFSRDSRQPTMLQPLPSSYLKTTDMVMLETIVGTQKTAWKNPVFPIGRSTSTVRIRVTTTPSGMKTVVHPRSTDRDPSIRLLAANTLTQPFRLWNPGALATD